MRQTPLLDRLAAVPTGRCWSGAVDADRCVLADRHVGLCVPASASPAAAAAYRDRAAQLSPVARRFHAAARSGHRVAEATTARVLPHD